MKKPPKGIGLYLIRLKSGEQKYQSRLWNPLLGRIGKKRTWDEKDLNQVLQLHLEFKSRYESNGYEIITARSAPVRQYPDMLLPCAGLYEKYLKDDPELVPAHQAKHRSKKYIGNTMEYVRSFLDCLRNNGYKISHTHISAVNPQAIGLFYGYLEDRYHSGEIGEVTWNKHFKACLYWFRYLQSLEIITANPFERITLKPETTDPQFVELKELEDLLDLITPENGIGTRGKDHHTVDHYRPWLKTYILVSVFIGGRPDQIVNLRWSQWKDDYIILDNSKINNAKNERGNKNYVYVHPELAELLAILSKGAGPNDFILVPEYRNRAILKNFVSRSFKHYWRQLGSEKDLSLNNLRHTYINAIINVIGEEGFSVHNKKETAIRHYLSKKKKLDLEKGKSLFNIDVKTAIN